MDPSKIKAPDIPNIEILEVLGVGGMSTVFKARHLIMDEFVAVKVISPGEMGEACICAFLQRDKTDCSTKSPEHNQSLFHRSNGIW